MVAKKVQKKKVKMAENVKRLYAIQEESRMLSQMKKK
jgi:hypothetical protein